MPDISHLLRPDIAALEPYTPIVPLEVLAERLGRPIDQIIKLDANENPYGASPRALEALASYPHYAIYPDPEHTALRAALSAYTGQPAERLICGAGSDELIDLLMRAFLMPGDAIINCGPTFGMYPFDAQLFAAKVISVPRTEGFAVDIEAVADAAQAHGAKMVFLANPNNPTGTMTPRAEIERLLELPMLVVVDEAYAEFAGQSLIDMVGSRPNLVVLRTFSKWAGLAGLRVGYAAVPGDLIAHLWKIKQPYNVNCAAEQAALASLADLPYLQGLIDQIVAERGRLMGALAELPLLTPFPSSSNFVLCRVAAEPGAGPQRAMAIKRHLESRGILIRHYTTPALADCIRISVGRPEQNDALLAALRELD